jgi:hypothetical protein
LVKAEEREREKREEIGLLLAGSKEEGVLLLA